MLEHKFKVNEESVQVHGNGLFSKEEVIVEISKSKKGSGITFKLNGTEIKAGVDNVTNSNRNIVLSCNKESLCLVEHFLAACSLLNIKDLLVKTSKPELVFGDGSAIHWYEKFLESGLCSASDTYVAFEKYDLKKPVFLKEKDMILAAIPYNGFRVSYFLDWVYPYSFKIWASWVKKDGVEKLLGSRSFARKEENDFFNMSNKLLTISIDGFNKKLHEVEEPAYHKILDIIGDLSLSGINPLEINMYVLGCRSGHSLNVELAKILREDLFSQPV